jgi:hypothetical protein
MCFMALMGGDGRVAAGMDVAPRVWKPLDENGFNLNLPHR